MKKEDVEKLIDDANESFQKGDVEYIAILNLDYAIVGDIDLYEGVNAQGEKFCLVQVFLMFNDEYNASECMILMEPEKLLGIVQERKAKEN